MKKLIFYFSLVALITCFTSQFSYAQKRLLEAPEGNGMQGSAQTYPISHAEAIIPERPLEIDPGITFGKYWVPGDACKLICSYLNPTSLFSLAGVCNSGYQCSYEALLENPTHHKYLSEHFFRRVAPKVRKLNLVKLSEMSDATLCQLSNLTSLTLSDSDSITDAGTMNLTNLTKLDTRRNFNMTNEGFRYLTKLTKFRVTPIENITSAGFTNLTNLTDLHVFSGVIENNVLKVLTNLTRLRLDYSTNISDEGLQPLTKLKFLQVVGDDEDNSDPPGIGFTDDVLSKLINLNVLNLTLYEKHQVSDNSIQHLTNLASLRLTNNVYGQFTDDSLRKLTNLTILNLRDNSSIIGTAFRFLKNLSSLSIDGNGSINGLYFNDLQSLESLSIFNNDDFEINTLTNLTRLELYNSRPIGDRDIRELTNLRSLTIHPRDNTISHYWIYFETPGFTSLGRLDREDEAILTYLSWEGVRGLKKLKNLNHFKELLVPKFASDCRDKSNLSYRAGNSVLGCQCDLAYDHFFTAQHLLSNIFREFPELVTDEDLINYVLCRSAALSAIDNPELLPPYGS